MHSMMNTKISGQRQCPITLRFAGSKGSQSITHGVYRLSTLSKSLLRSSQGQFRETCNAAPSRQRVGGRRGRQRGFVVYALFEKFTERSIKSVMLAQEWCRNYGSPEVTPVFIFLGLISEDPSKDGFLDSNVTAEATKQIMESMYDDTLSYSKEPRKDIPFSKESKSLFEQSLIESRRMGMSFIAPEHILLAVISSSDPGLLALLDEIEAPIDYLRTEAILRVKGELENGKITRSLTATPGGLTRKAGQQESNALNEYCRDLCAEAASNHIDPVIGRSKEIARVAQILVRRTKNNVILLGEPGVGKTAIAEGLARAITLGSLPDSSPLPKFLENKRVMQLDVGLLIAGAKERGELESRVTRILAEAKDLGNVILMIDEVHTLVGSGTTGRGGLDIANLLKPALARGHLQCIGATTFEEHRKHIERDTALERRFQPVIVDEPSEHASLEILEGLKERYERHHHVIYAHEALDAAVALSSRYIADRQMPDKCLDLIDEAGSRVRIAAYNARRNLGVPLDNFASTSYNELTQIMDTKEEACKDSLFEEAALLRAREMDLKSKLSGSPDQAAILPVVSVDHIKAVVSAWTGIPISAMNENDVKKLQELEDGLRSHIIGQDKAVDVTARAVGRAVAGLKNPGRPIATLLFSGPTGVGKTELAKRLAEGHFGSSNASHPSLIRLDMSEYMERHSVSKLIGSPPGYVGFGDGGKLTEAIRRRPFSLVLFDEIEKAHPDVFNILLQILEDGRLTDSQGRVVSFRNSLVVLTTNVGSSVLARGGGTVGFELPEDNAADKETKEESQHNLIRSLVMEELKSYFRPELLNRLDEVVVFRRLNKEDVAKIAELEIAGTAARAARHGIALSVSPQVLNHILEEGYSESMGARELRRVVVRLVDDPLSESIVRGQIKSGDAVSLRLSCAGTVEAVPLAQSQAYAEAIAIYEEA